MWIQSRKISKKNKLVFMWRELCWTLLFSWLEQVKQEISSRAWFQSSATKEILLGYYAAHSGHSLQTFRYKLSVPFSRCKDLSWPLKLFSSWRWESVSCPTSIRIYHYKLHNIAKEGISQFLLSLPQYWSQEL